MCAKNGAMHADEKACSFVPEPLSHTWKLRIMSAPKLRSSLWNRQCLCDLMQFPNFRSVQKQAQVFAAIACNLTRAEKQEEPETTGKHRRTPANTREHRKHRKTPEKPPKNTKKHRKTQKNTEKHRKRRETPKNTGKHQKKPENTEEHRRTPECRLCN